jgi:hypothetical protein
MGHLARDNVGVSWQKMSAARGGAALVDYEQEETLLANRFDYEGPQPGALGLTVTPTPMPTGCEVQSL